MERSTAGSATNLRVPHPSRSLRRVGSKNLDTNVRVSHPLQRTQRMGHPEIHGPSCLPKHEARLVSSQKAAHVDVGWVRAAGDPGFARDDKGRVALPLIVVTWDGQSDSTDGGERRCCRGLLGGRQGSGDDGKRYQAAGNKGDSICAVRISRRFSKAGGRQAACLSATAGRRRAAYVPQKVRRTHSSGRAGVAYRARSGRSSLSS